MIRPLVALVFLALAPSASDAPVHPGQPGGDLRLPVQTAYVAPDPEALRFRGNADVIPFTQPGLTLQWFAEFWKGGVVQPAVEVTLPRNARVRLRLTVSTEPRDGNWETAPSITYERSAVGGNGPVRVPFDSIGVSGEGYVRFALDADGGIAPQLKVHALLLRGGPATDAIANRTPRRNAASVHLRYPVDSALTVTGFYNEIVAVDDPVTTYYMATGFARGYFGMQVNSPTERRIIFSVWDAGNGTTADDRSSVSADDQTQLLAKGEGVVAEVFGNEGTGGHSHLVYPWKTGSVQRFYVTAQLDGTHTIYSGYWFHPERNAWMLIARFRAPKDGQGLRRLYSFSENFGGETGHLRRRARFGPAWIRLSTGELRELTSATFSHDPTGRVDRLDRMMGVEEGRWFLQHGGFVSGSTATGTVMTRPATARPPRIDLPPT